MRIALYLLQMLTHLVLTTSRRVTAIDVNICCTQVNVTHMRAAGYLVLIWYLLFPPPNYLGNKKEFLLLFQRGRIIFIFNLI